MIELAQAQMLVLNQASPGHRFNQARPWPWWPVIELAQMLVLNQAKPWPPIQISKPWSWEPVIELVQAQHWASTRQGAGRGHRFKSASPGSGGR